MVMARGCARGWDVEGGDGDRRVGVDRRRVHRRGARGARVCGVIEPNGTAHAEAAPTTAPRLRRSRRVVRVGGTSDRVIASPDVS
jgi:hypothetical protein